MVSYDAATHQWGIIRSGTFDGKYLRKRITAVCSFYQWGNHPMVKGPDACGLNVGEVLVQNLAGKGADYSDVLENDSDGLAIIQGDPSGPHRVWQQFNILKEEVLPDDAK